MPSTSGLGLCGDGIAIATDSDRWWMATKLRQNWWMENTMVLIISSLVWSGGYLSLRCLICIATACRQLIKKSETFQLLSPLPDHIDVCATPGHAHMSWWYLNITSIWNFARRIVPVNRERHPSQTVGNDTKRQYRTTTTRSSIVLRKTKHRIRRPPKDKRNDKVTQLHLLLTHWPIWLHPKYTKPKEATTATTTSPRKLEPSDPFIHHTTSTKMV